MKAFHGNEELKAQLIAQMKAHRAADELIQGLGAYYPTDAKEEEA